MKEENTMGGSKPKSSLLDYLESLIAISEANTTASCTSLESGRGDL